MDIREDLRRLQPPQFGSELEERRGRVIDWLRFIRDFGCVDTTSLIERAGVDDDFLDAVEVIAETGDNAATVYDAVRSFAVQLLLRERPLLPELDEPAPPQPMAVRVSPHSVPVELLRECFKVGSDHDFILGRLGIRTWSGTLTDNGAWTEYIGRSQMGLLTTIWCRIFPMPDTPLDAELIFNEVATNRVSRIPLLSTLLDYVPLFVVMSPNSGFDIRVDSLQGDPAPLIKVFVEGWTYQCY